MPRQTLLSVPWELGGAHFPSRCAVSRCVSRLLQAGRNKGGALVPHPWRLASGKSLCYLFCSSACANSTKTRKPLKYPNVSKCYTSNGNPWLRVFNSKRIIRFICVTRLSCILPTVVKYAQALEKNTTIFWTLLDGGYARGARPSVSLRNARSEIPPVNYAEVQGTLF